MNKKVELLAPAGSMESFYAAVNSGTDAVYLGGKNFNARQNSRNFDNGEMVDIIRYAHNKGVKVYVTVNTLLKDKEICDAMNYVVFLYESGVDAVIVQDMGLLYLIRQIAPKLTVNISTQSVVYDRYGVDFYLSSGVGKIIMARELNLEKLKDIAEKTKAELEVFIHGALCASYSGQCYMSSFLGGRSGNRGKCAQPCRLNYTIYDRRDGKEDVVVGCTPLLSMKDFKAGSTVSELIDAGISAFKIEGRMKGPEYTSAVVQYYRQIIDNHINGTDCETKKKEERAESAFSRGFTNGYLKPSDDTMFAMTSSGVRGNDEDVADDRLKDRFEEFSQQRRVKVDFDLTLKLNAPAELIVSDGEHKIKIKSRSLCESSEKNPVTEQLAVEQLSKLGSTIFSVGNMNMDIDDHVFVSKSTLNQLRRDALDQLYDERAVWYDRMDVYDVTDDEIFGKLPGGKPVGRLGRISLKINKRDEVNLADKAKVSRVYIPFDIDADAASDIDENIEKYLWVPNIMSDACYNTVKKNLKLYDNLYDGVCVGNVGAFQFFLENSKMRIHCGSTFNILNSFSAELMRVKGAAGLTFSVEANAEDMESISRNTPMMTEIVAHAFVETMIMRNCPMSVLKGCKGKGDCKICSYRDGYALKDRKNVLFNTERKNNLTHIYNSVPLTVIGKVADLKSAGIDLFLIDTKWLDNAEDIIDALYCELMGVQTGHVLKENGFTRGHYFKNIL